MNKTPKDEQELIRTFLLGQDPGWSMIRKLIESRASYYWDSDGIDLDDVKQDVLMGLVKGFRENRYGYRGLKGYVSIIFRNQFSQALKRKYVKNERFAPNADVDEVPGKDKGALIGIIKAEKLALYNEAISGLTPSQQEYLVLRYHENMSHKEIGERLGIQENTSRKRLHDIYQELRSEVKKLTKDSKKP